MEWIEITHKYAAKDRGSCRSHVYCQASHYIRLSTKRGRFSGTVRGIKKSWKERSSVSQKGDGLIVALSVQSGINKRHGDIHDMKNFCVDKKNQLEVTFCILYFSSNSCSTCFGQPCAHHQELTTA
jgi:hypothetical protein